MRPGGECRAADGYFLLGSTMRFSPGRVFGFARLSTPPRPMLVRSCSRMIWSACFIFCWGDSILFVADSSFLDAWGHVDGEAATMTAARTMNLLIAVRTMTFSLLHMNKLNRENEKSNPQK